MLSVYGMKDELRRPMMLLVKAAIPKNCKEETSKPFSKLPLPGKFDVVLNVGKKTVSRLSHIGHLTNQLFRN